MDQINGSSFAQVSNDAKALARAHTTISWGSVALSAVTVPIAGIALDCTDKSALATVRVDDAWLAAVAGLPVVSRAGLTHLANAVGSKGWVSAEEALEFVEMEERASKMAPEPVVLAPTTNRGAALLLARAEAELPGTLARVAEGAKDVAVAALGVINFTKEVAILSGKSLGFAASLVKTMRS